MAPSHQSAKWVFTEFINNTGYANSGLVFLLGMLQAGWTLVRIMNRFSIESICAKDPFVTLR
jgi:hypothetical protein